MKKFLNIIIVAMLGMVAFSVSAQDRATAVLQHGTDTKVYYGEDAFISAYADSQAGDVISLSVGTFKAPETVEKKLKIVGAGHNTVIKGKITFDGSTPMDGLWIEGVCISRDTNGGGITFSGTLNNTTVKRVRFNESCDMRATGDNFLMLQNYLLSVLDYDGMSGIVYDNCIIKQIFYDKFYSIKRATVNNCFIDYINRAFGTYKNCFIRAISSNSSWTDMTFVNVVGAFEMNSASNVQNYTKLSENEFYALFVDQDLYQLTESAAAQYLGTDGTQIGIYGGETPYTTISAIPQIVEANIGSATNSEGKLPVRIKVQVNN